MESGPHAAQRIRVAPQLLPLRTVGEAERRLEDLVRESVKQRESGEVPALSEAPQIRYQLDPPGREFWATARETYQRGSGDCDKLAIWLAADLRLRGLPATVRLRRTGPRRWHALVVLPSQRYGAVWIDPSKARGMRGKDGLSEAK